MKWKYVVVVVVAFLGAACSTGGSDRPGNAQSTPRQTSAPAPTGAEVQNVAGQFHVDEPTWIELIEGTDWNRCDGEPECDGEECYGVGSADGLADGAKVLVTNADLKKVRLGELHDSWGWIRNVRRGACIFLWDVDVPAEETGVLTVTFDDNPDWTVDFTLAEMADAPHKLDFISIG